VVLHRVGRETQGPIDSVTGDRAGRFRFHITADTSALYLISSRYAGIEYFSPPLHTNPERPDTGLVVVVADTSHTAPIEVAALQLVVSRPTRDGTRPVLQVIGLHNPGERTRISPDSGSPSWGGRLPAGVINFEPRDQGDFSPEAVTRKGDSVLVFAPISPGDRQVVLGYSLLGGASSLSLPVDQVTPTVNLLVEEAGARVTAPGLLPSDSMVTVGGRSFRHWSGALPAHSVLRVAFAAGWGRWLLPALVVVMGAILVVATLRLRRPSVVAPPAEPEDLVERMARLDLRYRGREEEVGADEWRTYQQERERLRAELARHLAKQSRTS
jgi:hypothetical protein